MIQKVAFLDKFELINEYWSPKIVGELNGQYVKLAKLLGEFVMHSHQNEDEMFLIVKGTLKIEFNDGALVLNENEFCIIPRKVEHKPIAESEVWIMLFEPITTLNTGNIENDMTVHKLETI